MEGGVTLDGGRSSWQDGRTGTFGENLVIEGLDTGICRGRRLVLEGGVILEATSAAFLRHLCGTDGRSDFPKRYTKALRPGFYCRVIVGGSVMVGEGATLQAFEGERVTIRT